MIKCIYFSNFGVCLLASYTTGYSILLLLLSHLLGGRITLTASSIPLVSNKNFISGLNLWKFCVILPPCKLPTRSSNWNMGHWLWIIILAIFTAFTEKEICALQLNLTLIYVTNSGRVERTCKIGRANVLQFCLMHFERCSSHIRFSYTIFSVLLVGFYLILFWIGLCFTSIALTIDIVYMNQDSNLKHENWIANTRLSYNLHRLSCQHKNRSRSPLKLSFF